jgi:N-acetylglucosamine-6-phosphate deacetylase
MHKGSIEVGKDADMVVLDEHLDVMLTMREGREIFVSES